MKPMDPTDFFVGKGESKQVRTLRRQVDRLESALAAKEAECERLKTLSKAQYEELSELANDNFTRAEAAESRVAELEAEFEAEEGSDDR